MCFYRMSNRHTWRVIFGRDLSLAEDAAQQRAMLADAVVLYLSPNQS